MLRYALSIAVALILSTGCEKSDEGTSETATKPGAMIEPSAPAPTQTVAKKEAAAEEHHDCAGKKAGEACSAGCDQWNEAAGAVTARDVPADAEWTTMAVEGMTCGGCEQRIIANLGGIDGIYAVEADAELGQVRVATAKGKKDLQKQAADKISSLGYRVQ